MIGKGHSFIRLEAVNCQPLKQALIFVQEELK